MTGTFLATLLCLAPPAEAPPPVDPAATPVDPAATPDESAGPDDDGPDAMDTAAPAEPSPPSGSEETAIEASPWSEQPPMRDPFEPGTSAPAQDADTRPDARRPPTQATAKEEVQLRPDRPIRYRIDLQLDGGTHNVPHGSFRAFSLDRNLPGMGVGVRADFRLAGGRLFVGGGVAYRRYASSRDAFDLVLHDSVRVQEPLFFLRVSLVTLEGVDVYVEPGGGPAIVDVELSSTRSADQRTVTGMFNGLAGLSLYMPKKWLPRKGASRVTGGLDLGLGFGWRGRISVQPSPETDDDPLDTSAARFGDLALAGFIWRAGLFVRFM